MERPIASVTPSAPVELAEGDAMPTAIIGPITRTHIVRYAGAGGDLNPIHHDEEFAKRVGFPSVFAMGMLQGGALAQRLARWVGPENVKAFSVRFAGQVWPGDILTLDGRVTTVTGGLAEMALTATRQTDELVLRATAAAAVR